MREREELGAIETKVVTPGKIVPGVKKDSDAHVLFN